MGTYRYIPRSCLLDPSESSWHKIWDNAHTESSFTCLVRLNRNSFNRLLLLCDPDALASIDGFTDRTRTQRRPGPLRVLDAPGHLGMALTWMASMVEQKHMATMFGVTNVSSYLRDSLQLLLDSLKRRPEFACALRGAYHWEASADAVDATYGECPIKGLRCCGAMDCFVLITNSSGDILMQNKDYNGKNKGPAGNCLTVVDFLGFTVFFSGPWEGKRGDVAVMQRSGVLKFLRDTLPPGFFIVADEAFGLDAYYDIIWSAERFNPGRVVTVEEARLLHKWCHKIRKSVEWQNHSVKQLWPRLKVPTPPGDRQYRADIIEIAVRLTNLLAAWEDGHVQTKTVFQEGFLRSQFAGRF